MQEKRNKKLWKWVNNPVKKDLYSGKYNQKIKPIKKDEGPTVEEGMKDYYTEEDGCKK